MNVIQYLQRIAAALACVFGLLALTACGMSMEDVVGEDPLNARTTELVDVMGADQARVLDIPKEVENQDGELGENTNDEGTYYATFDSGTYWVTVEFGLREDGTLGWFGRLSNGVMSIDDASDMQAFVDASRAEPTTSS